MNKYFNLEVSEKETVVCLVEMSAKKFVNLFVTFIVLAVLAFATPRAFAQDDDALMRAIDAEVASKAAEESKPGFVGRVVRKTGSVIECGLPTAIVGALIGGLSATGKNSRSVKSRAGDGAAIGAGVGLLDCHQQTNRGRAVRSAASIVSTCEAMNDKHRFAAIEFYNAGYKRAGDKEMSNLRRCDDHLRGGRRDRNRSMFYTSN